MGDSAVGNALTFVLETVFGIYILIVMLRFLLQLVRANFYNPISEFIVQVTQPPLRTLRRVIPGVAGVDIASLVLLLALQMLEVWLVLSILGQPTGISGLVVLAVARLLRLLIYVFMFSIIAVVIFSWVEPRRGNPAINLLYSLSDPVLRPFRRMLPPVAGFDLSPIVPLLVLGVLLRLLIEPLAHFGASML